jgi:hypothetical protein
MPACLPEYELDCLAGYGMKIAYVVNVSLIVIGARLNACMWCKYVVMYLTVNMCVYTHIYIYIYIYRMLVCGCMCVACVIPDWF